MFNAAFLSGPVETEAELARSILLPSLQFNTRGLEWSFWVCEDWLAPKAHRRLRQVFDRYGLRRTVGLPGMVTEKLRPPTRRLPEIDVRRVRDSRTGDDFRGIGSVCFHVPIAWFNEVFDQNCVWDRFAAYVGYVDGEPVATAATSWARARTQAGGLRHNQAATLSACITWLRCRITGAAAMARR